MSDPFNDTPAPTDASDFFASGSPSCRFNNIGDFHQGKIVEFGEAQQRDIVTGAPTKWPDGNPKMMLIVTLQTDERDPEIDDDDGQRRLYVNKPSGMFAAIKTAINKEKFAAGGSLAVKYVGNGKPKQPGFSPPKEYAAKYTSPNGQVTSAPTTAPPALDRADRKQALMRAWKAFQAKNPGMKTDSIAELWKMALTDYFGEKPRELILAVQWDKFVADGFAPAENPIPDEGGVPVDDIQF